MSRICDGRLAQDYEPTFERIDYRTRNQDMLYNGRLTKGVTYMIGYNEPKKHKFYITIYAKDDSVELWSKRETRAGAVEETHACFSAYEVECATKIMEML